MSTPPPPTGSQLVRTVVSTIGEALPPRWSTTLKPTGTGRRGDATVLDVTAPGGEAVAFLVKTVGRAAPQELGRVVGEWVGTEPSSVTRRIFPLGEPVLSAREGTWASPTVT